MWKEMETGASGGGGFPTTLPTDTSFVNIGSWTAGTSKTLNVSKKAKAVIVAGMVGTTIDMVYYYSADDPTHALYMASNNTAILSLSVNSTFSNNSIELNMYGSSSMSNCIAMIIY